MYTSNGQYIKASNIGSDYWPSCSPGTLDYDQTNVPVSHANSVLQVTGDHQSNHMGGQYGMFNGNQNSAAWLEEQYDPSE